ncbi:hypothetical protein C6Y62_13065 [Hyphomicrobium sulfonivorans]|nr:hypothetical protein [Hyphomicrobium sulfonivorans]
MQNENNRIVAQRGSSDAARINQPKAKHQGKDFTLPTGDPWTPIEKDSGKPLTLDGSGFHYRRIVNLLDGQRFIPAPLQTVFDADTNGPMQMVFAAVVRGQGETQGYHERRIAIPERLRPAFMRKASSGDSDMAQVASQRVSAVSKIVSTALRPALFALYQAAAENIDFKDPKAKAKAETSVDQFESAVDEDFFDHLFDEVAEPTGSAAANECRRRWIEECLWPSARNALAAAEVGSPFSGVRCYRARGAAKAKLDGAILGAFPDLLKRKPAA